MNEIEGIKKDENLQDIRVALLGNVDSGKSSLVGALSKGILDDGRGLSRSYILNHPHEQERGQTSSVALEVMGFDRSGKQVLPNNPGKHIKDFQEVGKKISKKCSLSRFMWS